MGPVAQMNNLQELLPDATRAEVDGLKAVALEIVDKIYALPILERCVKSNFERNVRIECEKWIDETGENELGRPFSAAMRDHFYSIMVTALGKALGEIDGYCE